MSSRPADPLLPASGLRAEIKVWDIASLSEGQPEIVKDLCCAAPRYIQRVNGHQATRVKGCINLLDGEHTGVRAGRVLRHGC